MWIERIEIVGFGVAPKERIELSKDAINLCEDTDQNTLLIPAVVLAGFYGACLHDENHIDPRLRMSNFKAPTETQAPFLVSIEFYTGQRKLRLTRNLNDDKIMILDRSRGDNEVTHEFVKDGSRKEAGDVITGFDRKHLQDILLLASSPTGNDAYQALGEFFKTINNGVSPVLHEAQAVQAIDQSIAEFPYKTLSIKINFLVDELEKQRDEVKNKIEGYLARRNAIVPIIARLREIEPYVGTEEKDRRAQEYFKACLRAAELDGQVMQFRSFQSRYVGLKRELIRLAPMQDFTIESQRQIEELWTRRKSRLSDYHALADEVTPKIVQYEQQEMASKRKWESLHDFTPEQAQAFAQMAANFKTMHEELEEFEKQLVQKQLHLAHQPNINLAKFERSKKTMQALETNDANDAKSYAALLTGFRNQAAEADRGKFKAETLIKEIEDQRQAKAVASSLLKMFKPTSLRQKELEGAAADLERHSTKLNELKVKIAGLESRLAALAAKAGVADGALLVQHINDYNTASSQLKELDVLAQMIESRRSSIQRLKIDIEPYFKQSGRKVQEVTVAAADELSEELQSCMNDLARLEVGFEKAKISREQLEFLLSEVRNIEEILAQLFANANLDNPGDIEASYSDFYGKVAAYHHWRQVEEEVTKTAEQYNLGDDGDFNAIIADAERERRETWERIRYLVEHHPEIADQLPPKVDLVSGGHSANSDTLLDERDKHVQEIRGFFSQFGNEYPALADKLETLERELARTKANQMSLELAREKLNALLSEDLAILDASAFQADDASGQPLPLFVDVASLGTSDLEMSVALKFFSLALADKRQIILLASIDKFDSNILMQSALSGQRALQLSNRRPANPDGSLQRT